MRIFELVVATALFLLGVRSLVHWVRRPFETADPRDHLWFAAFVIGRVGVWWSLAGLFLLSAGLRDPNGTGAYVQGRAYTDLFRDRYGWLFLVIVGFGVLQFVAGAFLGRRSTREERPGSPSDGV